MACAPSTFPAFGCIDLPGECGPFLRSASSKDGRRVDLAGKSTSDITATAATAAHRFRQHSVSSMLQSPLLSQRGQSHARKVTPFWDVFERIIGNAYCHETNPTGICNLAISNNYLLEPELLAFFRKNLCMVPTDLTYGTSLFGSHRLFASLCTLFNSTVFAPRTLVEPQHLITGPGCGPLLDQVFEHLCDSGDAVLIAAPYYNGYDADLSCRSHVHCLPVSSDVDDGCGPTNFEGRSALRRFAQVKTEWEALHTGKVRAVIVCNPHNPVGRCYDREALLEYGRFAEENNLHVVFDEIFAMSTFTASVEGEEQPESTQFHSALSFDWAVEAQCHPARIHIIWSASKDFGVNGLRIGTIVSQANAGLIRAMKATAKLYMVSSAADALFSALIDNQDVCRDFVQTNQSRMAQSYEIVAHWCRHHRIEYVPSRAGHFMLLNLERFLPESIEGQMLEGIGREGALWALFLDHAVCLTPGSNYHHPHLGTFRLTFTLRRPALLEGLSRIEHALQLESWSQKPLPHCCVAPEPMLHSLVTTTSEPNLDRQQDIDGDRQGVSTSDRVLAEEAKRASMERRHYVEAFHELLLDSADGDLLKSCGMGLPCAC